MKKNERKLRRRKLKQRRAANTAMKTKRRHRVLNLPFGTKRFEYNEQWVMEDGERCYRLKEWHGGNIIEWCLDAHLRLYGEAEKVFRVSLEQITLLMLGKAIFFNTPYQTLKLIKETDGFRGDTDKEEFFEQISNDRDQYLNENGIPSHYFDTLSSPFKNFEELYHEMTEKLCNQSPQWLMECCESSQEMPLEQIIGFCGIFEALGKRPPYRTAV